MSKKRTPSIEEQREKARRRIGVDNPRCGLCGCEDPICLELHHIAGQKIDETVGIICRNCHRLLSALQREHPDQIGQHVSTLEKVGHFLLGLADLLGIAARKLKEFGSYLLGEARNLCEVAA